MSILSLLLAFWLWSAAVEITLGVVRILWGGLLLFSAALLGLGSLLKTLWQLAWGRLPR